MAQAGFASVDKAVPGVRGGSLTAMGVPVNDPRPVQHLERRRPRGRAGPAPRGDRRLGSGPGAGTPAAATRQAAT